jgi:DNA helicase HerA-like ATPase
MSKYPNNLEIAKDDQEQESHVKKMDDDFALDMEEEFSLAGDPYDEGEEYKAAVGRTMFDTANSKDHTVTVVVPKNKTGIIAAQSLVRIDSLPADRGGDGKRYIGAVVEGPFAEPDGLRGDSPIMVTTTARGGIFMPPYHGRVQVGILGEETAEGNIVPPRFRPIPNSPVYVLSDEETSNKLGLEGDISVGDAVGFSELRVNIPSKKKSVLPRHVGVLGTTGGGKTTTVSGQISQYQQAGIATILFDTEGEYTAIGNPTEDSTMIRLLANQGRLPEGVKDVRVHYLVGRETTAEQPTRTQTFKLDFSVLSPYLAADVLGLNEAQRDRFIKAYDVLKIVLREMGIFPQKGNKDQEMQALEIDEFETGYPEVTLLRIIDIARFFLDSLTSKKEEKDRTARAKPGAADSEEADEQPPPPAFEPYCPEFMDERVRQIVKRRIATISTSSEVSWKALLSKLWMLNRIKIFDVRGINAPSYTDMLQPGRVSIIDLSDTDSPIINNLVISAILRGLQLQQEIAYKQAQEKKQDPTPAMIIIEEAHEFLSRERISEMENLYQQVARIARRGRKRWLGLMFVTQLPQHLPDEVLGLVNNYILHKIGDSNVINRLKRSIGGIDEGMWNRLPNLAPGQAVVSMANMARPLLVSIDPTPCKLRMVD